MPDKTPTQLPLSVLTALEELAERLDVSLNDLMTEIALTEGAENLVEKAELLLIRYYLNAPAGLYEDQLDWDGPSFDAFNEALASVRKMNDKS